MLRYLLYIVPSVGDQAPKICHIVRTPYFFPFRLGRIFDGVTRNSGATPDHRTPPSTQFMGVMRLELRDDAVVYTVSIVGFQFHFLLLFAQYGFV